MTVRLGIDAWPCYPEGVGNVIARTPGFSMWHRCLRATSTLALVESDGPWTILVPNDALFSSEGARIDELELPANADALSDFVESLVIPRSVLALQIESQVKCEPVSVSVTNLLDQPIVVEIGAESLRWNGAVSVAQIMCANGELHVIERLPRGTNWPIE